jgi:hypothetical protein
MRPERSQPDGQQSGERNRDIAQHELKRLLRKFEQ